MTGLWEYHKNIYIVPKTYTGFSWHVSEDLVEFSVKDLISSGQELALRRK